MTLRTPLAIAVVLSFTASLHAQVRPLPRPAPPAPPPFSVRLFGDAGMDKLSAGRSFNAIFGQDSGTVYGGGAEVVLRSGLFFRVGAWRLNETGERAVRLDNQTYKLGIPLTVTIVPVEVTGGYRFPLGRGRRFVAYAGGGVSSHGYEETSSFAEGSENVSERFTGYQLLGGLEYRLHRLFGVAGEVQYTAVPDALGAGGLSAEFNEDDLGGVIVRARVLFGR